jgi:diguanylate cyclase (GGDEF)-like protein
MKARIHRLLHYDALTGLPTLAHMHGLMHGLIEHARREDRLIALITLNIDGFRLVDEGFGRVTADAVLRHTAAGLSSAIRPHDTTARIGPDEFLAILTEIASTAEVFERTQRMLESISAPSIVAGHQLRITATAGVAIFPDDGTTFETLLSKSNAAMRDAKTTSRGGQQSHFGSLKRPAQRRMRLESGLSHAIKNDQLSLHYQTQYSLDTGDPCGVEALARWVRPGGKTVSPAVFIPLAEQTGLIESLGSWVLQKACNTVLTWHMPDKKPPLLCVNVSALQLSAGFPSLVAGVLSATGFPAERLELEITESALMRDINVGRDCLLRLSETGVRIAVDDFGTGYSSLSYLSTLPVSRLKIDRSLTRGMITDKRTAVIVETIIMLGRQLGLEVLAEGVETEQQREALRDAGCLQAQGYLLGRPMPARRASAEFRNARPEPVLIFAPHLLARSHYVH